MLAPQAARAMVHNTLWTPLAATVTLLTTVVLTRRLSLEAYGIYAIASSLALTLVAYGDLGVSASMAKFLPEIAEREGRDAMRRLVGRVTLGRALLFGAIGLTLALAPRPWLRLFGLEAGQAFLLTYVAAVTLLEGVGNTFVYVLVARFQATLVNVVQVVYGLGLIGLLLLAVAGGYGLAGVLAALVGASLMKFALGAVLAARELRRVPRVEAAPATPWQARFLNVSFSAYFQKAATWLHTPSFLVLIMAASASKEQVALFALAGEFVMRALSFVLNPTNGVILPAFAVAFARGAESAQRVFRSTIRLLTVLAIAALVVLLAVTPDLLRLLYSARYAAAAPLAMVLLVFYFLEHTIYAPASAALLAGEQLRALILVKGISAALVILYPLLRPADLMGWAVLMGSLRLGTAVLLLAAAVVTHRLSYPARSLRIFAAGAVMALPLWLQSWLLPLSPLPHVLLSATVGALGMVLCLRLFGAFDEEDRRLVRSTGLPLAQAVARIM